MLGYVQILNPDCNWITVAVECKRPMYTVLLVCTWTESGLKPDYS
jgi:hypothetical protein